jgi:hypothetical protein
MRNIVLLAASTVFIAAFARTLPARADAHPTQCDDSTAVLRYVGAMTGPDGFTHGWMDMYESVGCGWKIEYRSDYDCQSDGWTGCGLALMTDGLQGPIISGCASAIGQKGCTTGWVWAPSVAGGAAVHTIYGDVTSGPPALITPR